MEQSISTREEDQSYAVRLEARGREFLVVVRLRI